MKGESANNLCGTVMSIPSAEVPNALATIPKD